MAKSKSTKTVPAAGLAADLGDINRRLTTARSIVDVTAQALDHGETDLEQHSAEILKPAAESLDEILSELLALGLKAEEPRITTADLDRRFDQIYDNFWNAVGALEDAARHNEREGDRDTAVAALRDCAGLLGSVRRDLNEWVEGKQP